MRSIDIAAEFDKLGIDYATVGDSTLRILCPYHEDTHPSLDVDYAKQEFICRACHVGSDVFTLLAKLSGKPRHFILARLDSKADKPVEVSVVLREHARIWSAPTLLTELRKRGISDGTIKQYFLGEYQGRVSIPIPNEEGTYVNVRRYLPGAVGVPKTMNLRGRGEARIYPFSQLQYQDIVLCGGEIKALAVAQRLNQHNIGGITLTCGEQWTSKFDAYFTGKRIWIIGDIDEAGIADANFRAARLDQVAEAVYNVKLPLDIKKFPKGDVNDFIDEYADDPMGTALLDLINNTPLWKPTVRLNDPTKPQQPPIEVSVKEAMLPEMVLRRFKSRISVTALSQTEYYIPKIVIPACDKSQPYCARCPIFPLPAGDEVQVPPECQSVLAMMNANNSVQPEEIKLALGIPECTSVTFDIKSKYKVCEARVQKELNLTNPDSDKTVVSAVMIDQDPYINEVYEVTGKSMPHPRTQRCLAIVSESKPVVDALSGFELRDPEDLLIFRPDDWTVSSIEERLASLYEEMSLNITKIYDRRAMHQIIDLTYHSMLGMIIQGKLRKGWMEVLIVGDSEQGKSDVAQFISEFYGLGERVDCKNATVAGLLGGCEKIGDEWFVTWGVIPTHDRKLVIMEELKGMKPEVLAKLTDMRSSGVAEIPKIKRSKAQARTRLVVVSNPPKGSNLTPYSYGVNAITALIPNPEDLRRFDIATIVNRNEISFDGIHKPRLEMPSTFTADQSTRLILWCWTRTPEEVLFADGTFDAAVEEAGLLCQDFTDAVPLLGRGGSPVKLLRVAAALAGRTFSCDGDYKNVIVRPCHVEYMARFLRDEYSKEHHGYLELSRRDKRQENLTDEDAIRRILCVVPKYASVCEHILYTDEFDVQDICHWCSWTRDEAMILLSTLIRNNALKRTGQGYNKTEPFSKLLRDMLANPVEVPKHIAEEVVVDDDDGTF